MSAKQQQGRGGWKDSSERKVSPVEAACVVESYLSEHNFTKTLTEFRSEAASIFSTLKNGAPFPVKSLSSILHDYVVIREEKKASLLENSKLENALKDEKMIVLQERNRSQMLVQQIHESIATYQAGYVPQSSPPQQCAPMLPVGHTTPPGIGQGLSRTPGSGSAFIVTPATKKRKTTVTSKISQSASIRDNAVNITPTAPATKKSRHILPSVSPQDAQPSPPWPMCGTVRKTSLNAVRPVQSSRHVLQSTTHDPKSLFSNPSPPAPQQPRLPLISPLPTSQSLPSDAQAQLSVVQQIQLQCPEPQPARTPSNLSPPTTTPEDSCHPDPKTPPPTSAPQSPEPLAPEHICSTDGPHSQPRKADSSGGNNANKCTESDLPCADHPTNPRPKRDDRCFQSSNDGEDSHKRVDGSSGGQTSPDSRTCAGTRGMKPSKTMRPLDFSSKNLSSEEPPLLPMNFLNIEHTSNSHESPSPRKDSPALSSGSDMDDVTLSVEETLPNLSADLASIDDILACLDDASFSELVGDILNNDACNVDVLPSSENEKARSLIGEDSFGFHVVDRFNSHQGSSSQLENILSPRDLNVTSDGSLQSKSSPTPCKRSPVKSAEKTKKISDKENEIISSQ